MQLRIERDRVHAAIAHLARDGARVEVLRQVDGRPVGDHALELRQDVVQRLLDVATHDAIVAIHAVTEIAVLVAIGRGPRREVPHVTGRNRAEVERIFA